MSETGSAAQIAAEGQTTVDAEGKRLNNGHFAEHACLNCDTALVGSYCHECGQEAHLHRTMGAFLHDLMHGVLHLEGTTWRTLPMLAVKPGELTRRYVEGQRARFVSPMALFLFSIFLMYGTFQIVGISPPTDVKSVSAGLPVEESLQEIEHELADDRAAAKGEDGTDEFLPQLEGNVSLTGNESFDKHVVEKWQKNPSLMLYKLQTSFYKFSWLLIPISIPFIWLLFAWKRQFRLYDHTIFVTYSLSFMTLLILALALAGMAGLPTGIVVLASLLIPPIHIYNQLRGAYGLSRFSAFWRLVVMSLFITIILVLFLWVLLLMGGL